MASKQISQLSREFFERETSLVASSLIGKYLRSTMNGIEVEGMIVETEAYLPKNDSACHANKFRTPRTEVMFGSAGIAYVYPIHAKYCFNIVTETKESGCAVLIRALEPIRGIDIMSERRGIRDKKRLTTGPACLCQALGIDRGVNGLDITKPNSSIQFLEDAEIETPKVKRSARIGVTSAKTRRLRFYFPNNPYVSGPAALRK